MFIISCFFFKFDRKKKYEKLIKIILKMEIHQRNNNISKDVQLYKIADSSNNQQKIKIVKASPVKNENKGFL